MRSKRRESDAAVNKDLRCDCILTSDSNTINVVWHHALLLEDLIELGSSAMEDDWVQASVRVEWANERAGVSSGSRACVGCRCPAHTLCKKLKLRASSSSSLVRIAPPTLSTANLFAAEKMRK